MQYNNPSLSSSQNYTLNRNSYGFNESTHNTSTNYTNKNTNIKSYQPYTPTQFQDNNNKMASSIKFMQNRVQGVEALVKSKKNFMQFSSYKPSSTFNPVQNLKTSTSTNSSSNSGEEKNREAQLRGSCPNIFKKFDPMNNPNLRNTTQFNNMSKYGFGNEDKKTIQNQEPEVVRTMKKTNTVCNNQQPYKFNPNKSISTQQLNSFKYNINKSGIKNEPLVKNNEQKNLTHSPAKIGNGSKTPIKFDKKFTQLKKSGQNSNSFIKNLNQANTADSEKKFKSLNQIWQTKQKQKKVQQLQLNTKLNIPHQSKIINGFEFGNVLGKGKFGQVFLARHHQTGFIAAIKKIVKSKVKQYKMVEQFGKQIQLHNALDHPNIVKFYGFFEDSGDIYLVLEYMNGGTLFDYLNQVYHLGVKQTIQFLRDIIQAIIYLHQKSIAHRDIKPENIVISSEGVAKLCDFGWSAVVQTSRKTYCGTFDYAPPQILERKSYDTSVDVWCIGVLTYQLLTGRVPFQGEKRNQIMEKIVNVDKNKIQYPIQVPQQAKDFIELLIQKDPTLRPKPSELLKHPFFSLCPPKVKSKKLSE